MTGISADPLLHLQHRPPSIVDHAYEELERRELDGGRPAIEAPVAV
jgi:hypothetical protein